MSIKSIQKELNKFFKSHLSVDSIHVKLIEGHERASCSCTASLIGLKESFELEGKEFSKLEISKKSYNELKNYLEDLGYNLNKFKKTQTK